MKNILALLALVLVPATAIAQNGMPAAGEATGSANVGQVAVKAPTEYDFDPDNVEGNLVNPDEIYRGEQHGKTSSLIQIRADFVPEVLKSVENF